MLSEVRVRQLGVIEDLTVVLGPGMTALTGETGAGKTLVVEALQLLLGGRADPVLVRGGATEAVVEGRFVAQRDGDGEEAEVVLARVVPAEGRSRAYADGQMATLAALAEMGERLVDLHGQHAHQSLFSAVAQRQALDRFGGVSTKARRAAADEVRRWRS
jgi:DNA repair protein RecN (Recombination protein N)